MEEMFEDKVLDDLFDIRTNGLERRYLDKYGEPEELKEKEKIEQEMMDLVKKLVPDIESQNQIIDKFQNFKENMMSEICFWHKPYYKMGFIDGLNGKKEIIEIENDKKYNDEILKNSFIHNYIIQFIRENKKIIKRKDYKITNKQMNAIKKKYPNVRAFFEDGKVIELTKDELKAIYDYIVLDRNIEKIEIEESFKLGLKENNVL